MTSLCLNGDCLSLMKDLSDNSIDLFLCDLPYGCLKTVSKTPAPHGAFPEGCHWDVRIDLDAFWIQVKRLAKDKHTPVIMFCTVLFGNTIINSNPSWFRYELIWNKNYGISFLLANKMPMKSHEMIYIFSKKGSNYNRIDEHAEGKKAYEATRTTRKGGQCITIEKQVPCSQPEETRCSLSVLNFKMAHNKKHPTCKPTDLYEWLIKRYSNPGDTVLDPTAGSFNSGRACVALKRNYIGMEKDAVFYEKNKL